VEGTSNVVDVVGVEASNGDSSVHGHVDGVLLSELGDHIFAESSEGEHTNLRDNVIPVVLISEGGEAGVEGSSHLSHSGGHEDEV